MYENYAEYLNAEYDPLYNRATMGAYAPGSTFKPLVALAALSESIINTETRIDCEGIFSKYADQGYAPECWIYTQEQLTHGNDNVSEAIRDSCNYFFYTIADMMGIDIMDEYAADFGLGESTGIEIAETTGNMANPDNHLNYDVDAWVYGDTVQAGHRPVRQPLHPAAASRVLRRHCQRRYSLQRQRSQKRPQLRLHPSALQRRDQGHEHRGFRRLQLGCHTVWHVPHGQRPKQFVL